ncbi:MAG: nitrogen regulatory protein P-II, nitrogen regulatory protein P-II 1 [Deltaproteobacteria bacterium CSP1-8]|nr:MAG: nitrogen regulatory protein P-II, nitrogen regulatory protein P-II 1 [Deltaproteobacteria bacterium CSP1-8]OGP75896.1 MAG: transcriptional regulator [Deltaproteobacteria bacterium RBG_16_64_85]
MKQIIAFIKPHMLSNMTTALKNLPGLTGMSISEVGGFGRGRARNAAARISQDLVNYYTPRVRIEIFCRDESTEEIVSNIEKTAHTGLRGDGKIYVTNVETGVRISTGDRSEGAV